jgi:hypothetical protein
MSLGRTTEYVLRWYASMNAPVSSDVTPYWRSAWHALDVMSVLPLLLELMGGGHEASPVLRLSRMLRVRVCVSFPGQRVDSWRLLLQMPP